AHLSGVERGARRALPGYRPREGGGGAPGDHAGRAGRDDSGVRGAAGRGTSLLGAGRSGGDSPGRGAARRARAWKPRAAFAVEGTNMTENNRAGVAVKSSTADLERLARVVRTYIVRETTAAGSGHVTSSFSATELMTALFFHRLRFDLAHPEFAN